MLSAQEIPKKRLMVSHPVKTTKTASTEQKQHQKTSTEDVSENYIENEQHSFSHWAKLTSIGFFSGAVGQYSVYAVDTVKTRIQAANGKLSAFQCAKNIYTKHGLIGFYRGVLGVALLTSPEKSLKLGLNDWMRSSFPRDEDTHALTLGQEMLAGAVAGLGQVVITCPMEICKIRMQLEGKKPLQVLKDIGMKGLYRGTFACWVRDIPFSVLYFPAYHMSKAYFKRNSDDGELTTPQMFITGLGSGTVAAALVTPMDVVKTRIQGSDPRWNQMGVARSFVEIYKQEGFTSLWKGLSTRIFTRGPQFALTVGAYEFLQRRLLGFVQSDQ